MKTSAGIVIYRIADSGAKVLLVHNGRSWSLPKGRLLKNESTTDAAIRKLVEDASLVAPVKLTFIGAVKKGKNETMTCFAGVWDGVRPRPSGAIKAVRFFELSEAVKLVRPYQAPLLEFLGKSSLVA